MQKTAWDVESFRISAQNTRQIYKTQSYVNIIAINMRTCKDKKYNHSKSASLKH